MPDAFVTWLIEGGVGPAIVSWPVSWAASALAGAGRRWFGRIRRTDDLSRLVEAAVGTGFDLTDAEFDAVRRLLGDPHTWSIAGWGTVEDLANLIASNLPPRHGRATADSHVAAVTIARGLLEFAVTDLDPRLFQQVLLTRLQRMETTQGSKLDGSLFRLHADMAALLAEQGEIEALLFARVIRQLDQMLDRLPPGPADRDGIAVYLQKLIDWLDIDPWPQDQRLGGPVLTPAAIERKLRVTTTSHAGEQELDADDLAKRCQRLVILGGPGSGKTWLAKRTARRCAKEALQALAAGATCDEIELPLYTTCSRLFTAGGDIRLAAVSSALDQLSDLGGSRISSALRVLFTERNAPTVLVIDSLDEAHGNQERLRQADTLPWRIVLTTRPSSWDQQLAMEKRNDTHRVGRLQPLRYPEDVESFIHRWFVQDPDRGRDLAVQIARRHGLQSAATVPLVLAFYCIVSGSEPLPEFRRDLYVKVLRRLLTGRWRGRESSDNQPRANDCLQVLRNWARSGATSDPVSGVGTWADDISTEHWRLSEADQEAVDHVATPIGLPDVDTERTLRRFIHRSIREHLVAEHVACLSVDEAAEALIPHLWYDPDWEYAAPATIAMHPDRDQLLRNLTCRAAGSTQLPSDLSVIDAGGEFQKFLARVAVESSEDDWSPVVAGMIAYARVGLTRFLPNHDVSRAVHWPTSNRQAREALLGLLASNTDSREAARLVGGLVRLYPTAEDKRQARQALLGLLASSTSDQDITGLAAGLARLDPTAENKRQAREALLRLLGRLRLLASPTGDREATGLAGGPTGLDHSTADDKRQNLKVLGGLLTETKNAIYGAELADELAMLDPTAEDKRQAREALLGLLTGNTGGLTAVRLADGLKLHSTAKEKRQVRETLGKLASYTEGWLIDALVGQAARLDPVAEDKRRAREALLRLLTRSTGGWEAARWARRMVRVDPTAEDKRRARETLLRSLARNTDGWNAAGLARGVMQLDPTAEDKRRAREALLGLLVGNTDTLESEWLAGGLVGLDPTAEDKRQAREALLGLLAHPTDGREAAGLAAVLVGLDPTAEDKRQAREALLGLLAHPTDGREAAGLAGGLVGLDPTAEDKRQAREALLGLLAHPTDGREAAGLAGGLVGLDPTAEDKRQAREALLGLLAHPTDGREAAGLAAVLVGLDPTAEDKRQAREALLGLLASNTNPWKGAELARGLAQLDPTVRDLKTLNAWTVGEVGELLSVVRRNSTLAEWVRALPSLS